MEDVTEKKVVEIAEAYYREFLGSWHFVHPAWEITRICNVRRRFLGLIGYRCPECGSSIEYYIPMARGKNQPLKTKESKLPLWVSLDDFWERLEVVPIDWYPQIGLCSLGHNIIRTRVACTSRKAKGKKGWLVHRFDAKGVLRIESPK